MIKEVIDAVRRFRIPNIYVVVADRFPTPFAGLTPESKQKELAPPKEIEIKSRPALVVDTSALIDGRLADIIETGFISGTVVVPTFVIEELQRVADSKDSLKRNRGRRGLDVLKSIKKCRYVKFLIPKIKSGRDPIDTQLLNFAKQINGRVVTTDYNLNKVGKVTGVPMLNINELANMVKTVVLPGEIVELNVLKKGKEQGQGIGYLPDGTMVVVEDGGRLIGVDIEVKVERLLQTDAGKMIFAKPIS
ncbi:TRAM domain-containing protein [candidate division WWE3 bacterium]|nr:TRAM domain-containing protein [candidate division WWE3 bacterium]